MAPLKTPISYDRLYMLMGRFSLGTCSDQNINELVMILVDHFRHHPPPGLAHHKAPNHDLDSKTQSR